MSKRTDSQENQTITNGITIIAGDENGGVLESEGGIFTDTIQSNTINGDIDIDGVVVKTSTIKLTTNTTPSPPLTGDIFYIDTLDNKLKSINSDSIITTYTPSTTKGDLIVHNGTTQVRLPVG